MTEERDNSPSTNTGVAGAAEWNPGAAPTAPVPYAGLPMVALPSRIHTDDLPGVQFLEWERQFVQVPPVQAVIPGMWTDETVRALICERDQLQREIVETRVHLGEQIVARTDLLVENSRLRALLSRVEETATADPVKADIERTIDHLLNGRTTKDQRKGLSTATERAERVRPGDDAAVGRALR